MAVIRVPWVHLLTSGKVWASPRRPAPNIVNTALPMVQCKASLLGWERPERRIAL
ncbi:hypothetical protein D3C84_708920 [compost metagenome]